MSDSVIMEERELRQTAERVRRRDEMQSTEITRPKVRQNRKSEVKSFEHKMAELQKQREERVIQQRRRRQEGISILERESRVQNETENRDTWARNVERKEETKSTDHDSSHQKVIQSEESETEIFERELADLQKQREERAIQSKDRSNSLECDSVKSDTSAKVVNTRYTVEGDSSGVRVEQCHDNSPCDKIQNLRMRLLNEKRELHRQSKEFRRKSDILELSMNSSPANSVKSESESVDRYVEKEDTYDLDLRGRRELCIHKAKQDMVRREHELAERENILKEQEEMASRSRQSEEYDNFLLMRENEILQRMRSLEAREKEMEHREDVLNQLSKRESDKIQRMSAIEKWEKEIQHREDVLNQHASNLESEISQRLSAIEEREKESQYREQTDTYTDRKATLTVIPRDNRSCFGNPEREHSTRNAIEERERDSQYREELRNQRTDTYTGRKANLTGIPSDTRSGFDNSERQNPTPSSYHTPFPKFSVYSGEEPKPKTEATYDEWKYEVNCSRQCTSSSEQLMSHAIRKSLRGQAKRVLLPMGITATVDEILEKLEGVFGNVAAGESMLQEFYSTVQKSNESVVTWGLRLEEILQRAMDKGHVLEESRNGMLRTKFWKSLKSERLKTATRTKYENNDSFEELQRAVRAEEYEMKLQSVQHQPTRSDVHEDSNWEQVMKRITALEKQMQERDKKKNHWGKTDKQKEKQQDTSRRDTEPKPIDLNYRASPS